MFGRNGRSVATCSHRTRRGLGPIDAKVELPPATSAAATVFRGRPLTLPDDGQTCAVKHEMDALVGRDRSQTAPQMLTAPGERRIVGGGKVEAHHPEQGVQEPFGLTQREMVEESQGQGGLDGEIRVAPLPTHDAALPVACPACSGEVHGTHVVSQYQEDLPVVRPVIREFRVHVGACATCGRRVQGRHPRQTSDALGAAAVQIGPEAVALVVVLHTGFGLPLAHVVTLLRDRFGIRVPRGALGPVCARMATRAPPTYEALCAQGRGSPVVSPDETGWKVAGTLHWLWAVATADPTVYAIRPGRGFVDAATILGKDFAGVLARDGWAPYRRVGHADHQTCGAHLLRRCRLLQLDHPRSPFAARVQQRLQQALALRDRYAAGDISPHGLASARGRLLTQTLDLLTTTRSTIPAVQRFAAHLTVEASALFTFLGDPAIDATNWRAEHALRPAVVMRKVCGGNRSVRGAQTQQVLTSVLRTTHQRGLDPARLLATILRAPTPSVPPSLQAPPP